MGVRGLKGFIEENGCLLTSYKLSKCTTVIDGNNLIYFLHHLHAMVLGNQDHVFGGDYTGFANIVKAFFNYLSYCEIRPVVVLDGGYDKSDVKKRTWMSRLRDRILHCAVISKKGICGRWVLPILCQTVFVEVLKELGIRVVQCDFEADAVIAMLSKHFEGPVISNDSDFFIFDLPFGVVPLQSLNFNSRFDGTKTKKPRYITCQYYHIDRLIDSFPGLQKDALPLFSCIMGNDYVDQAVFDTIFSSLPIVESSKRFKKFKNGTKYVHMIQLLDWMRNKTVEEATESLVKLMKASKRNQAESGFQITFQSYKETSYQNLLKHLTDQSTEMPAVIANDLPLPEWFKKSFNAADIDSTAMNVLIINKLILLPQVEEFSLPSSYSSASNLISLYLKILYSLNGDMNEIVVFNRKDKAVCKEEMRDLPSLNTALEHMPKSEKIVMLLDALGTTVKELSTLKSQILNTLPGKIHDKSAEDLSILMHVWKFWVKQKDMDLSQEFLISFVTTTLYCFVKSSCDGSSKEDPFESRFDKYLLPSSTNHSKPLKTIFVHFHSEIQGIILFFKRVNSLLGFPLSRFRVHNFLNGTLLYNMVIELLKRPDPALFSCQLLGRDSNISKFFKHITETFIEVNKYLQSPKTRTRKKGTKPSKTQNLPVSVLELDVDM